MLALDATWYTLLFSDGKTFLITEFLNPMLYFIVASFIATSMDCKGGPWLKPGVV
jgi:hypothetical protein